MPTRLIRDGILTSERVSSLSWEAEVFYRRLMSVADDYGLYDARPSILRSALYPLQLDKMSECNIKRCLSACEAAGLILLFSHSGKPYLMLGGFGQTLRSAPKHPLPNGFQAIPSGKSGYKLIVVDSDCAQLQTDANNCKQLLSYADAESYSETDAESNNQTVSRPVNRHPGDVEEVRAFMAAQLEAPKGDDLIACARGWYDDAEARGWCDTRGVPYHDWRAAARKYARSWAINNMQRGGNGNTGRRDANDGRSYK